MYRLMISFKDSPGYKYGVHIQPKEYILLNSDEVCKVINGLSHLQPIVTLCQVPVMSADDVLKDFEAKEV